MSIRLALAGNPNCGKTTMFNDLTGATQYVGNWPGVTVEKKEGKFKGDKEVLITDLPGIYSLSPYTLEEVVARDYLVNEKPQDSDMTTQCIAIMGSGKRLIESMSVFIERPNMAEVVSLGAKLAALKKLAEN